MKVRQFTMRTAFIAACALIAIGLSLWSGQVSAQTTVTPTLGPSKTPTTGSVIATETPASTLSPIFAVEETVPFEPLSQSDMTVLTGNVQRPNGITWFENKLYTACTGDSTLYEIDATTGVTTTYIFGVSNAHTMVAEEDANNRLVIWTPDYVQNSLLRVTRAGVEEVTDDLNGPWGITELPDTSFLVTNLLGSDIRRISREGEVDRVLNTLASPTGIVHDGTTVYVANTGSTRRAIEYYPMDRLIDGSMADADAPDPEAVLVSGLQNTTGLALGADGKLYFAYSLGTRGVIGRVDPIACAAAGGCSNEQVEIVLYTELEAPLAGLVVTPDMRLFVHTMFNPDIYWAQL